MEGEEERREKGIESEGRSERMIKIEIECIDSIEDMHMIPQNLNSILYPLIFRRIDLTTTHRT